MPDEAPRRVLAGKAALITGGARRIGRETALTLAAAGADVAITYKNSATEAAEAVREIEARGARGLAVAADVRSEASVQSAISKIIEEFGRLDILVNNAAIFTSSPLESTSIAAWDAIFETNARGPFLVVREALPHLRAAQGRIINIGSLGGSRAWAGHAAYCSSKAALEMLTRTMAKAFAPEVSVNLVAPGYIEMGEAPEETARVAARTPMQRNGTAGDVAQAVLFFAAGSKFITGQSLGVDGGLEL
jgi:3-oxoacyl-[acyl-carrier protein] reductase/pteridine reductase